MAASRQVRTQPQKAAIYDITKVYDTDSFVFVNNLLGLQQAIVFDFVP